MHHEDSDDDHDGGKTTRHVPLADSTMVTTVDHDGGGGEDDSDGPIKNIHHNHPFPLELSGSSSSPSTDMMKSPNKRSGGTISSRKRTRVEVSSNNSSWQEFCNRGSLFKTLLDGAVDKVATAAAAAVSANAIGAGGASSQQDRVAAANEGDDNKENNNDDDHDVKHKDSNENHDSGKFSRRVVENLLREKTTECLLSQQKLEQQQSQLVALQAMVDDLREAKKNLVVQTSTLTGAYKQARQNAKRAR